MQRVGNFFMAKDPKKSYSNTRDPKQAVVTAQNIDEHRDHVDDKYQKRADDDDGVVKDVNFAKDARSELDKSSKLNEEDNKIVLLSP